PRLDARLRLGTLVERDDFDFSSLPALLDSSQSNSRAIAPQPDNALHLRMGLQGVGDKSLALGDIGAVKNGCRNRILPSLSLSSAACACGLFGLIAIPSTPLAMRSRT